MEKAYPSIIEHENGMLVCTYDVFKDLENLTPKILHLRYLLLKMLLIEQKKDVKEAYRMRIAVGKL